MSLFGDFLVRIFLNLDWIGRFTKDISVCSPNAENYARKNPNTVTFHAMYLSMNVVLVLLRLPSGKLGSALFFYKHTGKLGWSSICLWFSQFKPEIMFDGMLNFKTHFMVWYCVWYEHCNGLFNIRNLVSSLILMF